MSRALGCLMMVMLLISACAVEPTPTLSPSAPASGIGSPSATLEPTAEPSSTVEPSPSASPEPPLSLALPDESDPRVVEVTVAPDVAADGGGEILVTVTSAADERIDELVLRWPTDLRETLFLAPFTPTDDRIRNNGPPLVQPWTKWVIGPGERGEPDGTISLGYGPLLADTTLEIRIFVTRNAPGSVAFDLQVLSGNDLLTLDGGEPAELRVEVP